jgi:N-acylglucosamine 2-epimerase
MSQKVSLRAARITTLTFMALTWIIAIKASAFGGILSLLVLWFGAMVGPISIAMLLGLLPAFRHSGPAAANAGLVAGLLAFAYVKYGMADASMAVTIGIPVLVSAVVYIGIGLLTRGITPRREVLDLLNAIGSDETACDNPIPRQKAQCFDTTKNGDEGDELTRYIPQYFSLLIPKLRRDAALVASCENGTRPEGRDMSDLKAFYRDHLTKVLLPFWQRAFDQRNGGVFTCFTNGGEQLLSKDKFTWSQGRLVWLLSHLAELHAKGLVSGDAGLWQRQAAQTVAFLRDHAFMPNGNCAFLLSETGEWKETVPGEGYDVSFYADCFVILGFSEYARVFQDQSVLVDALALYRSVEKRLAVGSVRSEPYPIPSGYRPHSFSMIMLHVTEQLHAALASNSRFRLEAEFIAATCDRYLREIMETFWKSDGRVTEIEKSDGRRDTILARHFNPGHTLECMWFVLRAANKLERPEYVPKALAAVAKAFELGWDERYGGLLRFVDLDGGSPRGNSNGDPYEQLIVSTWDTKLWWPHSEALYTTLLAHQLSGSPAFLALYEKTHDYVFSVFPHPDAAVGEWIQIRDRGGTPLEKVVALPVKDPYHILRNVMLILELLDGDPFGSQAIQENERQ